MSEPRPSEQRTVYRDIVVAGASAGGVEALRALVQELPAELPASMLVVLHMSATGRSVLPQILERAGKLPATVPRDGQRIERGHIYVAPPDRHLLLMGEGVRLTGGPRENGHRPAIDPLFRSAARGYGPRVIAVVLSGTLDDGAAGVRLVKERGGTVLCQDPDEALYRDMPVNAASVTDVDGLLRVKDIAARICELVQEPITVEGEEDVQDRENREARELAADEVAAGGSPSELACPECGGTMWERNEGPLIRFACRVGHVFSPESLIEGHSAELERALWAALRSLEERADLYRRMAHRAEGNLGGRFESRARSADEHAGAIREAISKINGPDELEEAM